ncbi:MAG: hypothetical protein M3P51_09415 [Chloroflexota bacterium]|nr:hypothetical protein [Chloroflexota bacterium]
MRTRLRWTTGTVLFLYFCGALFGANLTLVVEAVRTGAALRAPLLGVLVALMLPILPLAHTRRTAERSPAPQP